MYLDITINGAKLGESLITSPDEMYDALEMIQRFRLNFTTEFSTEQRNETDLEEFQNIGPDLDYFLDYDYNEPIANLVDEIPDLIIAFNMAEQLKYD